MLNTTPFTPTAFAAACGWTATVTLAGAAPRADAWLPADPETPPGRAASETGSEPAPCEDPVSITLALPDGHTGFGACHDDSGTAFSYVEDTAETGTDFVGTMLGAPRPVAA